MKSRSFCLLSCNIKAVKVQYISQYKLSCGLLAVNNCSNLCSQYALYPQYNILYMRLYDVTSEPRYHSAEFDIGPLTLLAADAIKTGSMFYHLAGVGMKAHIINNKP